jgi:broad specificity phosphatase PhoE
MTKVILVRLAETEPMEEKNRIVKGGFQKSRLSKRGRQQAIALRERLRDYKINAIFSSDRVGCIETAEILAEPHNVNVIKCSEFNEINIGEWEGRTHKEIKSQHPKLYELFFHKVPSNSGDMQIIPGGETWNQVRDRTIGKLNEIVKEWEESTIIIVSHGHVIKVMICSLLGLDFSNIWKIQLVNTALNLFQYDGENVTFHFIGDISHLEKQGIPAYDVFSKPGGLQGNLTTKQ